MGNQRDAIVLCCGDGQHRLRIEARLVQEHLSPAYCDFISAPGLFKMAGRDDVLAVVLNSIEAYQALHQIKSNRVFLVCDAPCSAYGGDNNPKANARQLKDAEKLARAINSSAKTQNVPTKVLATWP